MKHYLTIIFLGLILFSFSTCRQKTNVREYYIISTGDSTDFKHKHDKDDKSLPPPPPPLQNIIKGTLFSDLVVLLDSTDIVYLYQTEVIKSENHGCCVETKEDYQNFIKLNPEHLITFDSKSFINFIEKNNDIFHFDTTSKLLRIIFIASNKDTIMNPAFYDFVKLITSKARRSKVIISVRKTTEEENYVMYCKRNSITYNPMHYSWSKNSLISKFNPFTKQYDSIENSLFDYIVRARMTYKMDTIKTRKGID